MIVVRITAPLWVQGLAIYQASAELHLGVMPIASDPVPLLCQALCQTLYEDVSSLGLVGRGCYYPHFADEGTEAQGRGGAGSGSCPQEVVEQDTSPSTITAEVRVKQGDQCG